jgi:hypothetical protein
VNFGAQLDMQAIRRASVRWQRSKARRMRWQRLGAKVLRPFNRVRMVLHDRLWRRVERSEAALLAAENAEIAAVRAQVERIAAAALIGSAIAHAQLVDIAADRVGQARRNAALEALIRLREHQTQPRGV